MTCISCHCPSKYSTPLEVCSKDSKGILYVPNFWSSKLVISSVTILIWVALIKVTADPCYFCLSKSGSYSFFFSRNKLFCDIPQRCGTKREPLFLQIFFASLRSHPVYPYTWTAFSLVSLHPHVLMFIIGSPILSHWLWSLQPMLRSKILLL